MRSTFALGVLCLAASWAFVAGPPPGGGKTHSVALNGQVFTLPAGFTIELAAAAPLVERPITADFDEEGNLYVSDSSGSNEKVAEQLKKKPHRIVRLEDTNEDGRFDKRNVFADKMMFPEGTLWHAGSLYVAAPPSIWKLTDTDGDGVADQRVEWFAGKTLTGCANDLHGPYLGPDGRIYWCKGAFAEQTYERPGKKPLVTKASHIFRSRAGGEAARDIEAVMTGGMDNPVDVVFTPGGERIFTTTFFQHPSGGKRDGLIHAVYGGVYGKDHDPVHHHPWTAPELMPVLTHMGPAAPCGFTRYESSAFGPDYKDNLFACQFNMHKVSRHVLTPSGATFTSRDEDFLVSSSLDFHPTDVLEDADGSLLVLDTGGWYKLCCPTSQLVKPDVLGAIYRIRRQGAPKIIDPRGKGLHWAKLTPTELARLLDDPRPAVRKWAIETLGTKGSAALPALEDVLKGGKSPEARRNAVWALTRIEEPRARQAVRGALADRDQLVRQAALHSVSLHRDRDATSALLTSLKAPSAQNRRGAAEALGRTGDGKVVPALLSALGEPSDRFLEHSLTYALIEIADRKATSAGLTSANARTRRAALIALDQMEDGKLEASTVARELHSRDAALKEAASWVVGHHPEWGLELAGVFRRRLGETGLSTAERDDLARQLGRLAQGKAVQDLLADQLGERGSLEAKRTVLRAMTHARLKAAPEGWLTALTRVLASGPPELRPDALAAARALPPAPPRPETFRAALLDLGENDKLPAQTRLTALAATSGLKEVPPGLLTFLQKQLDHEQPVTNRALAAEVLARAKLTPKQLIGLADVLQSVGPMEINKVLEAFDQTRDEEVGRRLVASLEEAPALSALQVDALQKRLAKFGPGVQKSGAVLAGRMNADAAKQKAKLEQLLRTLGPGDIRRGQVLFNSSKAACSSCHAIGYLGGTVGPDLTRVGKIRSERDLLESIVFPSVSFAQGYEPVVVTTTRGRVLNGLLRKNTPEEVVLVVNANETVRLPREEVEDIQPSKVSVMPAGLDEQLSKQELADLVAFLKACQ